MNLQKTIILGETGHLHLNDDDDVLLSSSSPSTMHVNDDADGDHHSEQQRQCLRRSSWSRCEYSARRGAVRWSTQRGCGSWSGCEYSAVRWPPEHRGSRRIYMRLLLLMISIAVFGVSCGFGGSFQMISTVSGELLEEVAAKEAAPLVSVADAVVGGRSAMRSDNRAIIVAAAEQSDPAIEAFESHDESSLSLSLSSRPSSASPGVRKSSPKVVEVLVDGNVNAEVDDSEHYINIIKWHNSDDGRNTTNQVDDALRSGINGTTSSGNKGDKGDSVNVDECRGDDAHCLSSSTPYIDGEGVGMAELRQLQIRVADYCDPSEPTFDEWNCRVSSRAKLMSECGDLNSPAFSKQGQGLSNRGYWRGMAQIFGADPTYAERWFMEIMSTSELWEEYAQTWIVWYVFIGLAAVLGVVLIAWSGALCCLCCRQCYAKCCRQKCCHERFRARPIWKISKKRYQSVMGVYIAFPFVCTFCFIVLAIVFGIFAAETIDQGTCAVHSMSYVTLFGSDAWTPDPEWPGTFQAQDPFDQYNFNLAVMNANLTEISNEADFATEVDETVESYVRINDCMEASNTAVQTARMNYIYFDSSTATPTPPPPLPLFQYCHTCESWLSLNFSPQTPAQLRGLLNDVTASLRSDIADFGTTALDPVRQELPVVLNNTFDLDHLNNQLFTFTAGLDANSDIITNVEWVFYVVAIVVPALVLVLWAVALGVFVHLYIKHKDKVEPNIKLMRDLFACLCFFFGFSTVCLFILGVIIIGATQFPSEVCYFTDTKLFTENLYWDYPPANRLVSAPMPLFTENCLTYNPAGSLVESIVQNITELSTATNLGEDVRAIAEESRERGVQASNAFQSFFSGYWWDSNKAIILLDDSQINPAERHGYWFVTFKEILFGTTQSNNGWGQGGLAARMEGLRSQAYDLAGELEFTVRAWNSGLVAQAIMQNEIGATLGSEPAYGKAAQMQRLESELEAAGCRTTVCDTVNCCDRVFECVEITGSNILDFNESLFAPPPTSPIEFDLSSILLAQNNGGQFGRVGRCLESWTAQNSGVNVEFRAPIAWMIITGFNILAMRTRIASDPRIFTMFPKGDMTSGVDETRVPFDIFIERMNDNYFQFPGLVEFNSSMVPLEERLDVIADEHDFAYDEFENSTDCSFAFEQYTKAMDLGCNVAIGDLGLTAIWWIGMGLANFIAVFLLWRIFHYFADRQKEIEDELRRREQLEDPLYLLEQCKLGNNREIESCCYFQDPVFAADEDGNGCLHMAAYYNHPDTCEMLLEYECDPSQKNFKQYSPVEVATSNGFDSVVSVLVKGGGDIRTSDPFGDTPLHVAARDNDRPTLYKLLDKEERGGMNAPLNLEGETPAHTAALARRNTGAAMLGEFYQGEAAKPSKTRRVAQMFHGRSGTRKKLNVAAPATLAAAAPEKLPSVLKIMSSERQKVASGLRSFDQSDTTSHDLTDPTN